MAITITDNAAQKIDRLLQHYPDKENLALLIGVKGGGCSGLEYEMDIGTHISENKLFEHTTGVKVSVDPKSYIFINGTILDYEESIAKSGFVFLNPNATGSCGCGKSFTI